MPRIKSKQQRDVEFSVSGWECTNTSPTNTEEDNQDNQNKIKPQQQQQQPYSLNFTVSQGLNLSEICDVSGTGFLAFFEDGSFSGHFMNESDGRMMWLGMSGVVILAYSECMRDDDWCLIKIKVSTKDCQHWLTICAEKTGGDMAVFSHPSTITNSEKQLLDGWMEWENNVQCRVVFRSTRLLDGSEAENFLSKFNAKFCGSDAVINIGNMNITNIPQQMIDGQMYGF